MLESFPVTPVRPCQLSPGTESVILAATGGGGTRYRVTKCLALHRRLAGHPPERYIRRLFPLGPTRVSAGRAVFSPAADSPERCRAVDRLFLFGGGVFPTIPAMFTAYTDRTERTLGSPDAHSQSRQHRWAGLTSLTPTPSRTWHGLDATETLLSARCHFSAPLATA